MDFWNFFNCKAPIKHNYNIVNAVTFPMDNILLHSVGKVLKKINLQFCIVHSKIRFFLFDKITILEIIVCFGTVYGSSDKLLILPFSIKLVEKEFVIYLI